MLRPKFNHCQAKIAHLKNQVNQLKREKEQLRLLLHEMIEAYYRAINQSEDQAQEEANE